MSESSAIHFQRRPLYVSLPFTACHCLSLPFTAFQCLKQRLPSLSLSPGDMVGAALCCFTCGTSFMLSSIVFAVAWIFVRPLVSHQLVATTTVATTTALLWQLLLRATREHGNALQSHGIEMG